MADINDLELDFKVHDGYVAFSAEIVRLALLSPAVFAFFIAIAGEHTSPNAFTRLIAPGRLWLIASLVSMALAVLFGLCHRYFAIDFIATLVERRRISRGMRGDWRGWASFLAIVAAPFCLAIGTSMLFIAIFKILGGS